MNKEQLVIDFATKSAICEIMRGVTAWYKTLWKTDRKAHSLFDKAAIERYKDRASYWIMSDPEITVRRAESEINELIELIEKIKVKVDAKHTIVLDPLLEKAVAVQAMVIVADDHQKSFFA